MLIFEQEAAEAKKNRRRLVLAVGVVVLAIAGAFTVRASIPDAFWDFQRRLQEAQQRHQRDMLELMIPGPPEPAEAAPEQTSPSR